MKVFADLEVGDVFVTDDGEFEVMSPPGAPLANGRVVFDAKGSDDKVQTHAAQGQWEVEVR